MYSTSKPTPTTRYAPIHHPSNENMSTKSAPPDRLRLLSMGWIWEILATIASAGCLIALVVILRLNDNKPRDNWGTLISLNAIVAIFITASKSLALLTIASCLAQLKWVLFKKSQRKLRELDLFEDAARGPLGSLLLLFHVRWRLGIASIGAIITIVALGVDTFAQQVLLTESRNLKEPSSGAAFKVNQFYNGGANIIGALGTQIDPSTADATMQGAIFRGLFNMTTVPGFECPSTCSWNDSYISLGFRSECRDVTKETIATNQNNQTLHLNEMRTPSNVTIGAVFSATSMQSRINVTAVGAFSQFPPMQENQTYSPELARFAILRAPIDFSETGSFNYSQFLDTVKITECALELAAYKYSAIAASGAQLNFTTEVIRLENGTFKDDEKVGSQSNATLTFKKDGVAPLTVVPPLTVRRSDLLALFQFFESIRFSGAYMVGEYPENNGIGSALMNGNVSGAFDNMAVSMTEQLRVNSNETMQGVLLRPEIFVRVRWVWMTLPFAVVAATILLLIATIINNWSQQCQLWKSSQVAILAHETIQRDQSTAVLRTNFRSMTQLEAYAKNTRATIE